MLSSPATQCRTGFRHLQPAGPGCSAHESSHRREYWTAWHRRASGDQEVDSVRRTRTGLDRGTHGWGRSTWLRSGRVHGTRRRRRGGGSRPRPGGRNGAWAHRQGRHGTRRRDQPALEQSFGAVGDAGPDGRIRPVIDASCDDAPGHGGGPCRAGRRIGGRPAALGSPTPRTRGLPARMETPRPRRHRDGRLDTGEPRRDRGRTHGGVDTASARAT